MLRAIGLHKTVSLRVNCLGEDLFADRLCDSFPVFKLPLVVTAIFGGAIEGDPRHDFRVGEVLRLGANFPDAFVRLSPHALVMAEKNAAHLGAPWRDRQSTLARLRSDVGKFAIDVELQLKRRGIADADRRGFLIPGQPRNGPLVEPALTSHAVKRLNLLRAAGDGADEPVLPGDCLLYMTRIHEGEQRKGCVAQPAEA